MEVTDTDVASLPGEVRATVHATHHGRPLRRARVTFAGETARTDKDGLATLSSTPLEGPGRYRALVRRGQNYGVSVLVSVGVGQSALRVPARRSGAASWVIAGLRVVCLDRVRVAIQRAATRGAKERTDGHL